MATFKTFVPYDNSLVASIKAWGQSFGQAMLNFGWVAQAGHGEVAASSVSSVWTWTNSPVAPTGNTTTPRTVLNFRGAFSSVATYALNDTVTSAGLTFISTVITPLVLTSAAIVSTTVTYTGTITNGAANGLVGHSFTIAGFTNAGNNGTFTITASTATTLVCTNASGVNETHAGTATDVTAPGSNLFNWQPYNFEIFVSNGPMSSALPIYTRFTYGNTNLNLPIFYVEVGTGVDASGNLTGAVNLMTSAPTAVGQWNPGGGLNTANIFEMDFSGDADNFRMCPWRNLVAQGGSGSTAGPPILLVDRAKTATGADADGYVYVAWLGLSGASTVVTLSAVILKPSIGGIVAQSVSPMWAGVPGTPPTSLGNWGSSPPLPILPLPGYTANPCLGAIAVQAVDWQNGSIVPVWLYGAVHYFLVCGADTTLATYRAAISGGGAIPAIRWE